jgi:hypothetical protein
VTSLVPSGKGGLDLDVVDHFGDAFHDFVAGDEGGAEAHEFRHRPAIARGLQQLGGDERDGFRVVELQPAGAAAAGEIAGDDDEQLFLFARGEVHRCGAQWEARNAKEPPKTMAVAMRTGRARFILKTTTDARARQATLISRAP